MYGVGDDAWRSASNHRLPDSLRQRQRGRTVARQLRFPDTRSYATNASTHPDYPHQTKVMQKYIKAKEEFLTWLSEQAEEQNTELTINRQNRGYYREPDVLARLRATTKPVRFQTRNTNDELSVSDELNARFDQVLCVILQLSDPPGFNPQSDHFYPLRVNTIQRNTGPLQEIARDVCRDTDPDNE